MHYSRTMSSCLYSLCVLVGFKPIPGLHLPLKLHFRIGHGMWKDVLMQSSFFLYFQDMMHSGDPISDAKTGKAQDL